MQMRLIRRRIRPGAEGLVDDWLRLLAERRDECIQTLTREQMAVELIFRERLADAEYLTWVVIHGDDPAPLETSPFPIDAIHREYRARCLEENSRAEATAQLFLAPPSVERVIANFAGARAPTKLT
jgi:hypothetical protein